MRSRLRNRLIVACAIWLSLAGFGHADTEEITASKSTLRVAYPSAGETVRHDVIPIWIRSDAAGELANARVLLNDTDISERLFPGSPLGRGGFHAVTNVAPRPGVNHITLETQGVRERIEFRFEPQPMRVRIRVREDERPVPSHVSFHGLDGTPDPRLAPEVWSRISRRKNDHERGFAYTQNGNVDVHLPPGRYEVLAFRGPAYSVARGEIGPDSATLDLSIARTLDTKGWISADLHVHAMPSPDSSVPLWDRVVSFLAQDVDVIVASDHHRVTDYRSDLPHEHGWPEGFEAVPGIESALPGTNRGNDAGGHWNFWPIERGDSATRLSVIRPEGLRSVSDLYAAFERYNRDERKARFGDMPVVVQMNHPRGIQFHPDDVAGKAHGFLSRGGYNREMPLSATTNLSLLGSPAPGLPRPIDVDAIELLNRLAYALYVETRDDWLAWVEQGFTPTALANTDSHALVITGAGFPRNWVRYDGPLPIVASALAQAVRRRQVVGSTGPLIEVEPSGTDGHPVRGPIDKLIVNVRGPAWMPIEEIRVFVGGDPLRTISLEPQPLDPYGKATRNHRVVVPVDIDRDTYVFVEAGDSIKRLLDRTPHDGPLGKAFPNVRVLAFTNPLLIESSAKSTD